MSGMATATEPRLVMRGNGNKKYAKAVYELVRSNGRHITAKELVRAARPKSSPLHEYFEWDQGKAAEQYRLHQARALLCNVRIVWTDNRGKPMNGPLTVNVRRGGRKPQRVYVLANDAVDDKKMMEQIGERALADLRAWLNRYAPYPALQKLRKNIQDALRRHMED